MGKFRERGYSEPISLEQVKVIQEMSQDEREPHSRREIAEAAEVSKFTVYNYQKKLGLV